MAATKVYVQHTFWDTGFVARVIRAEALNPKPEPDFHKRPYHNNQTDRYRRQVEAYPWGAVIFINDVLTGNGATAVVIGEYDLADVLSNYVEWYSAAAGELAGDLIIQDVPREITPDEVDSIDIEVDGPLHPRCLGMHLETRVCDGGIGENGVELPCSWRSHCMVLQRHCIERGFSLDETLANEDHHGVVALTRQLLEQYGEPNAPAIENVEVKDVEDFVPATVADYVQDKREKKSESARRNRFDPWSESMSAEDVRALALEFWDKLILQLGVDEVANIDDAKLGQVYLADYSEKRRMMTGYIVDEGKDSPWIHLHLRRYKNCIYVQTSLANDDERLVSSLGSRFVKVWKNGVFASAIVGVGSKLSFDEVISVLCSCKKEMMP